MRWVFGLIFSLAISITLQAQQDKVYAQTTIIYNDNGTGSGRIRLSIQDKDAPFKITINRMEISTYESVVFFNKMKAGGYTITVSSSDESKKPAEFKMSIYQYIPDVYYVPIDSCIEISIDTTRRLAIPMNKIKNIQWYPKEHFSHSKELRTELCYADQKVGVKFEGVNDGEVYEKELSIYSLIDECILNSSCDPFSKSEIFEIHELKDDIYAINKFQNAVRRYFNKTREYSRGFTRMFGNYDWDKVISIDNIIYIMPLRKNGKSYASSFIVFNKDFQNLHAFFVSREGLKNALNTKTLNRSPELNAKLSLMQLVDFSYPGISDPNLVSSEKIFPNVRNGELCIGNYKLIINSNGQQQSLASLDTLFSVVESDKLCDYSDYNNFPTDEDLYWDPNVSSASEAFQILMKKCCDN